MHDAGQTVRHGRVRRLLGAALGVGVALAALAYASLGKAAEPIRLAYIEGMSGPFANAGQSWLRNLRFAVDVVNARGGVRVRDASGTWATHPLQIDVFDGKGQVEDSLSALRIVQDRGYRFVLQGASSAVAGAFIDAINRYNVRQPKQRMLFLNFAAVTPELTEEKCSFWHFRFDAHAGMRMQALAEVMKTDPKVKRVWLINQDYSFGREVARLAHERIAVVLPDAVIVGEDLHPIGRIRDFAPYVLKMRAAQVDTVVTGNWGADLALLVKAAREAGLDAKFYTFYGNSLGAPAAIGEAGVGRVRAVAEWHPNAGTAASDAFVHAFRATLSDPRDDYQHLRSTILIEMLAAAIERANAAEALPVARALEGAQWRSNIQTARMRAQDHQLQQPLYVTVMGRKSDGLPFDNEGSGYGFKTERYLEAAVVEQPTSCKMVRPAAE